MALNGECLLAAAGLTKFLEPGALRITVPIRERAAKWADGSLVRKEIKKFLAGVDADESEPPEFNYKETFARLTKPVSIDDVAESVSGVGDPDLALDFTVCASRACDYLAQVAPRRTRIGVFGPKPLDPDDLSISKLRGAYAAVDAPETVFAALRDGSLSADEMRAFSSVYPEVYDLVKTVVFDELAALGAKHPEGWEPSAKVERGLQVLLMQRTMDAKLATALQSHFTQADAGETGEKGGGGRPMKSIADIASQTDRIALK